MRKQLIVLLVLAGSLTAACRDNAVEKEGLSPGDLDKWNDPNYEIIGVGAYNYTDHDIYDVFILPPEKNDIKYAASASGDQAAPRNSKKWLLDGASGANLAWDYRWAAPKKFKVWWLRIVDMKAYSTSAKNYNKYTMKATQPGTAWCEGEFEVAHPPRKDKTSDLVVHFYPDGRVEGDIIHITDDASRVDIDRRDELPNIKARVCIKEIPNPYFGKKKPIAMY